MISETDLLCQQKLRLENALRATEIPLHIATDNLHCRQRRQGIDLVQDNVEIYLLKVRPPGAPILGARGGFPNIRTCSVV